MTGIIGKISSRSKIVNEPLTDGGILLGSGPDAITATAVLADSEMLVGDGTTDPAIESGATLRTSIGLGSGSAVTFTTVDTGQGANELYDMDQNVKTTSSPTFANIVGMIASFGMASPPTGYLACDGAAIARAGAGTYAALFAVLSTTWGVGDGSTTFNVPDLRGGFLRGVGASAGFTVNDTTVLATKQSDTQQGHYHFVRTLITGPSYYPYRNAGNLTSANGGPNGDVRSGNENRPNNIGVTFCIKY